MNAPQPRDISKQLRLEKKFKAKMGNYECPICRRFIWWDEDHSHKPKEKK